jgi:two-component system sensor histidine kinase KdpD
LSFYVAGRKEVQTNLARKAFCCRLSFKRRATFTFGKKKEIIKGIVRLTRFNILFSYALAVIGVAVLTGVMFVFGNHVNPTTVALVFLLFILFLATAAGSKPALVASALAMFCFNYFFLPPIGTITISDPQNWIAFFAFLVVAITAGQLSAKAKQRAVEAEKLYFELQEAFEKASQAEAFRQNEKLKSALLDAVTHDLRTPLTSIKASITMLIDEYAQDPIHRAALEPEGRGELLEVINEETDRLNNFIESMVEVAKIEAGNFHLRKMPTNVEEFVSPALRRAADLTENHQVILNIQKNLPPILVDSKALAQVVYNLIDNAVKYAPLQTSILIAAKRIEDYVEIAVEDEGENIPVGERGKIFEKFYRADKIRRITRIICGSSSTTRIFLFHSSKFIGS